MQNSWNSNRRKLILGSLACFSFLGFFVFGRFRYTDEILKFRPSERTTLKAIFQNILPSFLKDSEVEEWVSRFEGWLSEYKPNAEIFHMRFSYRWFNMGLFKPRSPIEFYLNELRKIELAGRAYGRNFSELAKSEKREILEGTLVEKDKYTVKPYLEGKNLVMDILSFYYRDSDVMDQMFGRKIGALKCRSLENIAEIPVKLT